MASSRLLCPRCGSQNHRHIDKRRYRTARMASANVVARGHCCLACHKEWVSIETPLVGKLAEALLAVLED